MRASNFHPNVALGLNPNANYFQSFYIYTISIDSIPANSTRNVTVNIETDSQFVWTKSAFFAKRAAVADSQTANTRLLPSIDLQLTDSGSARQFFDEAQPISSIAGSGEVPAILPAPYMFKPNSTINATLRNSSAEEYTDVKLSLIGFRLYEYTAR